MSGADTIFALSSGAPPAAIGVIRVSGPRAGAALRALAGRLPDPRHAAYRRLRDRAGEPLDDVLVLWLPGPGTATGEDIAEFHCHGGRAVVARIEAELARLPGLRRAAPGEFTRRAFTNGRIDLAEAEGLADLLEAETELQRRNALALAGGALSREVEDWRVRLLALSARVEAALDFSDEGDVGDMPPGLAGDASALAAELAGWLSRPRAEALREGFRVVLAGPPNVGKSTLFNALVEHDAAIATPIPGTTRDVLTRPVALAGTPFTFVDTAGLHDAGLDPVEAIGIARARTALAEADLVLWLGSEGDGPADAWEIAPQCDRSEQGKRAPRHRISAVTGEGLDALRNDLVRTARGALPRPGEVALNARQRGLIANAQGALASVAGTRDPLLVAEDLRIARLAFDALSGRTSTEDVLDTLFGRFCIGK
jgi:tRNA modification GTPase